MTRPYGTAIDWDTLIDLEYIAPKGRLQDNLSVMTAISRSVRTTSSWQQLVCRQYQIQNDVDRRASFDRHQATMAVVSKISDSRQQQFMSQSRRSDASQARLINAIRGVEIYQQGGYQYELPNNYPHVYGDGNGNFILTENSLYNPGSDLSLPGNWTKLSPGR